MPVNPTNDQLQRLVDDSERLDGEVVMLNLLRFRADAGDGLDGTGADAYGRYAAIATAKVAEYGGRLLWMGAPDQVVVGDDDADRWHAVALVSYPSRRAFLAMLADPDYQQGHVHREGGLDDMRLIAMTPAGGLNAGGSDPAGGGSTPASGSAGGGSAGAGQGG